MYNVGRAINGIPINGDEYLLDGQGNTMQFESEEAAIYFLLENGLSEQEITDTINITQVD